MVEPKEILETSHSRCFKAEETDMQRRLSDEPKVPEWSGD